jgi:subfamily B ATP-binding cassette protein HlyB/CyaB
VLAEKAVGTQKSRFGFQWVFTELMKFPRAWSEVLLASLVIQLLALGIPLFTQAVIDKVVVHRTESTLIALGLGMALFAIFTALLSWLRQQLMLAIGNQVDLLLGNAVFQRLLRLTPVYFRHRKTGAIAASVQCVDTVRAFISDAALALILDLPFLLIFVTIMLVYSPSLTAIVIAVLAVIALLSVLVAPTFHRRLTEQFQLGARNQAMITEYVSGIETVKALQLEAPLELRYDIGLKEWLQAGMSARKLANHYGSLCNFLEQIMSHLVLFVGAWLAMREASFTIGMLVAFQMFSSRLSQPLLKIVNLWQQLQQARLAIDRIGDVMDAPTEPYRAERSRILSRQGRVQIEAISFRHSENLPWLFENLSLDMPPGSCTVIMGPSGCGKSTLASMIQSFCRPQDGRILIDGTDTRTLSTQELRSQLGVVPQSTVLFAGTLIENFLIVQPSATFDEVVEACQAAEIHDTIQAMPDAYLTEVGERGVGLSGGQLQRISIARALLKKPSILLLDEATSALDAHTAAGIAQTLNKLNGLVTTICISHSIPRGLKVDQSVRLGPEEDEPVAALPFTRDAARVA